MAKKKLKVNEALINILAPTCIRFNKDSFDYGDNKARIYGIIKYPQQARSGFLNSISNIPHTFVNYHFRPIDNQILLDAMNKASRQQGETFNNTKSVVEQKSAEIALSNIDGLLNRMTRDNESMGEVSTMVMTFGKDDETFEKKVTYLIYKSTTLRLENPP